MAIIIAIDPGKASGSAMFDTDPTNTDPFMSTIVTDQMDLLDGLDYLLWQFDILICEDYIVTQQTIQKSRQNYSLEIIGALRYFAYRVDIPFVLQTPSQAKSFATDEKLKKIGWYKTGTEGHDNDAARHLLVYCVNNGIIPIERLV